MRVVPQTLLSLLFDKLGDLPDVLHCKMAAARSVLQV
jgi:hypothetical protein